MYIRNLQMNIPIYECNAIIGKWLVDEKSMPVLSKEGSIWKFSKTPLLEEVLKGIPFYLKVFQNI